MVVSKEEPAVEKVTAPDAAAVQENHTLAAEPVFATVARSPLSSVAPTLVLVSVVDVGTTIGLQ